MGTLQRWWDGKSDRRAADRTGTCVCGYSYDVTKLAVHSWPGSRPAEGPGIDFCTRLVNDHRGETETMTKAKESIDVDCTVEVVKHSGLEVHMPWGARALSSVIMCGINPSYPAP